MGQGIQTYGAELDALTLQRILTHVFRTNLADEESTAARPTPVCIWGSHGIGKTSLIKEFAHRNGWKFRYCAPAQFEEMGDLVGMPAVEGSCLVRGSQTGPPRISIVSQGMSANRWAW